MLKRVDIGSPFFILTIYYYVQCYDGLDSSGSALSKLMGDFS